PSKLRGHHMMVLYNRLQELEAIHQLRNAEKKDVEIQTDDLHEKKTIELKEIGINTDSSDFLYIGDIISDDNEMKTSSHQHEAKDANNSIQPKDFEDIIRISRKTSEHFKKEMQK